ncbi:hypothetical protein [Methanolapillus millepedarum]|uniref:Terpene cyclase/mutase family protein n=1 Tax=Methanolapillus millepedarum TaxID=3028296 RepID=A0AA97A4B7_9EURY|nr:hypothetical protein MsAc7_12460 [Methanosarcinaceae archaeon Ac7]
MTQKPDIDFFDFEQFNFADSPDHDVSGYFDAEVVEISEQAFVSIGKGLSWISAQIDNKRTKRPENFDFSVKELSNLILVYVFWNRPSVFFPAAAALLKKQQPDGSFGDIKDTARAVSSMSAVWKHLDRIISHPKYQEHYADFDAVGLMASLQKSLKPATDFLLLTKNDWSSDIYDWVYALAAIADAGIFEKRMSLDLCKDNPEWKFPGTTALILTALQKQQDLHSFSEEEDLEISTFIDRKANWLILERKDGHWNHIATSCLVLMALSRIDNPACVASIPWLYSAQQKNGSFEDDLNKTCLAVLAESYMSRFLY